MPERKIVDFKKLDYIIEDNRDYVIDKYYRDLKIIYSIKNDILIKMGKKNEWLSKDEIYITNYRKDISIDAPFATDYKVIFIKVDSKYSDKFINRHFIINPNEKNILNRICDEYKLTRLNIDNEITEFMIKSLFEQFFLLLIREHIRVGKMKKTSRQNENIAEFIISYLNERMGENIKFSEIVKIAGLSSTGLKNVFKEYTGMGVMQYYSYLKIERAKILLLEGELNATQISNILGYESIHYFSRQFKNIAGVSPTQYINQLTSGS